MSAIPKKNHISDNCKHRIKPTMLREVKTEALLVFCRTALERYFAEISDTNFELIDEAHKDTKYVYNTLKQLLIHLQENVVNVDYLINIAQAAQHYPVFRGLAKQEEPLMHYYNTMAQKVKSHYGEKPAHLPELLVICVLEEWLLGEEKSTFLYPFLNEIDFLELIAKFETNRQYFQQDGICKISEMHELSCQIIEKLQNSKYKANTSRISKTRKKKG